MIQEALEELTANRTVIVIAHRLSTIKSCNKIVVLEKGNIKQIGTHEELISTPGIYSSLHYRTDHQQVPS
jgi:ABC-type multidrug transport system fused ATPase/permease subunit